MQFLLIFDGTPGRYGVPGVASSPDQMARLYHEKFDGTQFRKAALFFAPGFVLDEHSVFISHLTFKKTKSHDQQKK